MGPAGGVETIIYACVGGMQVRDLMMYFEAQRVVEASGGESCLSNGTVLPMPQQVPEAGGKRRTPRKSR